MPGSNKNEQKQYPMQPNNTMRYIFWFIFVLIMVTYLFNSYNTTQTTRIPYTEFKNQIKKNKISTITMKGNQISGEFKGQYTKISNGDTLRYDAFTTFKPQVEDAKLLDLLEENNVTVNAESQDGTWLRTLLIILAPWVLLIGLFWLIRKRAQGQTKQMFGGGGGGLFGIGKSKAKRYEKTKSKTTFDDVAGLENAKRDLVEIIDYLKEPEKFLKLGADIPKGILLMGPPGTGKTLLARATAGEAKTSFFSISGSEFIEMFVGVGASRVRDMFNTAKKEAPSIIFIDELDSIGRTRGTGLGGGHDEREQTLNQVLSEMDGFEPHESVVVIAATNRPDVLDPALTRPGRFDRQITLELPHKEARKKILEIHTRSVPIDDNVDLQNLAGRTVGFSGADLKNLVNEAALMAGRKDIDKVNADCFELARDKILLGHEREDIMNDEEKKIIAYHETGHALMAKLLPKADPLQKVTIIPRGRSLGATEQVAEKDRHNLSKDYLLNRIAISLGGRAAELVRFENTTNGAASDLKQVTNIARKMVCQWGMSEKLGPMNFRCGEEHLFLGREMAQSKDFSEYTAKLIDEEIQSILRDMQNKAVQTLEKNKDKLDRIAEELLENETLENADIDKILKDFDNK